MNQIIINKKMVKKSKCLKTNQKNAKSFYGKGKSLNLKGEIRKIANLRFSFYKKCDNITFAKSNSYSYDELIKLIKEHSFVGLGGEANDISLKLEAIKNNVNSKILLVNACECEPGLVTDYYIIKNRLNDLFLAIDFLNSIFGFKRCILASKQELASSSNIKCIKVKDKYPMGYEGYLIKEILNIDLKGYPSDYGILSLNAQTVLMLKELTDGKEFNSRLITILNLLDGSTSVVEASFNTNIYSLVKEIYPTNEGIIYCGGGLLYSHIADKNEQVDSTTAFIGINNEFTLDNKNCKKCGRCERNCPEKIKLKDIVGLYQKNKVIDKKLFELDKCISCGLCSYNCPSNIDIRSIVTKSCNGIN